MQIAGIPPELERRSLILWPQSPGFLLAEPGDDGAVGREKQQVTVDQFLVAVEAYRALGSAIGGQAKTLATDIRGRHEQQLDPIAMFEIMDAASMGRIVRSSDDAMKA